jgi:hypothetical protein
MVKEIVSCQPKIPLWPKVGENDECNLMQNELWHQKIILLFFLNTLINSYKATVSLLFERIWFKQLPLRRNKPTMPLWPKAFNGMCLSHCLHQKCSYIR